MIAYLVLEDGSVFTGKSLGFVGTAVGEVVFNTSMTGYQEMLTDPSYRGQILTFTYPLIGNYGINKDDFESYEVQVRGVVVREICDYPSNFRSTISLQKFLEENKVVGISEIDTRALTKKLRDKGVMSGIISSKKKPSQLKQMLKKIAVYDQIDFVKEVTTHKAYKWCEGEKRVVVVDLGVKFNILRCLQKLNCEVLVMPATSTAEDIMLVQPQGIVFSPGPGNPENLSYVIKTVNEIIKNKIPIFGICLGHQILAHCFGGKTYKLKFGHRGANHPVKDLLVDKVYITAQNHGYAVDEKSLSKNEILITQINLNDNTVEGMKHKKKDIFSVQYHPEASPGPKDSEFLFAEFISRIK